MMKRVIWFIFSGLLPGGWIGAGMAQSPDTGMAYNLYLTRLAAAEAFLQLNKTATASAYLNACEDKYRGVEWKFIKTAIDKSLLTLPSASAKAFSAVKLNPSNNRLAVCGADSTVSLFSYPELKPVMKLKEHTDGVSTLAYSSNGKMLASGGRDHTVFIWDAETGSVLSKNKDSFSQGIYNVQFSPDDSLLAVASWERLSDRPPHIFGFVKILRISDGSEVLHIELDNHPASGVLFTRDGKNVLISGWGEIAYSYNLETGQQNWNFNLSDPSEYNAFHSIGLSPDGNTLALGSTDHRVYLLHTVTGELIHKFEPWEGHRNTIKAVEFSPDGNWLATAGVDQTIMVWDVKKLTRVQILQGHVKTVSGLHWTKDSKSLVSASTDATVKIWEIPNNFGFSYTICDFGPWQTPFTSDHRYFAAPCSDQKLVLYDVRTGNVKTAFPGQSALCADISSDDELMVTASFDGIVRVWELLSGKELRTFPGHNGRIDGVAFIDKSQTILSAGDSSLRVWTLKNDSGHKILPQPGTPFRVAVNPQETLAFAGFGNGRMRVYKTDDWSLAGEFICGGALQEISVSPDGTKLAVFCGLNIEIWNTGTFQLERRLTGHELAGYGVDFSPDSRYLISGSYDQTFKLWDLSTGACTLTFHGFSETIYNCKFISSSEIFLSGPEGKIGYFRF